MLVKEAERRAFANGDKFMGRLRPIYGADGVDGLGVHAESHKSTSGMDYAAGDEAIERASKGDHAENGGTPSSRSVTRKALKKLQEPCHAAPCSFSSCTYGLVAVLCPCGPLPVTAGP